MMTRRQFLPALVPIASLPVVAVAATLPTVKPLPANVPVIESPDQLARLAAAYALAYDRAAAVDWHANPGYSEDEEEAFLDAFDAAEEALFQAMDERETPAFVADGRTFINMQCDPDYIPDRPQHVMIMPRDGAATTPPSMPEWLSEGHKLAAEWLAIRDKIAVTYERQEATLKAMGAKASRAARHDLEARYDQEMEPLTETAYATDKALIAFVLRVTGHRMPTKADNLDAWGFDDWPAASVVIGGNLWTVYQDQDKGDGDPALCRTPLGNIVSEGGVL
jgi:hypothetical protein